MGKFKEYMPEQLFLLPPNLRDWLPEDHLAYFISDVVDELDLSPIYNDYDSSERGQPAYHPLLMVKLLLYAYSVGVPSSRKIEKKTYEDVAFRVLSAGYHPDHDTIAEFRKRHLSSLKFLFLQVLMICKKAGLVKLGYVALDSTKVKANASKHKAMSYRKMVEKEKELMEKVEELLKRADEVDREEDGRYGKGKRGDELPEELRFYKKRLEKIREAKAALEAEAMKKDLKGIKKEDGEESLPQEKAQRNFTDPDSRIMKESATKSFVQGYNAEIAVDASSQVIVASEVSQEAVDKRQFIPMVEKVKENTGEYPDEVSSDAGFFSEDNVKYASEKGIDPYISPDKIKHGEKYPSQRGRKAKNLGIKELMRRKLRSKRGWKTYSKRKQSLLLGR